MTNHLDFNHSQLYEFLDNVEELPRHIVMFYEEPEHARMVALRFIKNGLERGDNCTYEIPSEDHEGMGNTNADFGHDKGFIVQEMMDYGIDVTYYREKGLLTVYSFRDNNMDDLDSFRRVVERNHNTYLSQFGSESRFPSLRAIGRPIADLRHDGLAKLLQIERYFQHDAVARSVSNKSTAICTYKLNDITSALDGKEKPLISELLQNHDAVIYLPRRNKGLALRLNR